jgi:uroporphyrin-III C-methyltransferase
VNRPQLLSADLSVAGRATLVVGCGPAAAAATARLLDAAARVKVIAGDQPELTPALADLAARGRIELTCRGYTAPDVSKMWLVYPRCVDPAENHRIAADCRQARVWCVEPTASAETERSEWSGAGRVTLVGGGPGDPGLITMRGWRALHRADVVIVDRLAPLALLSELPESTLIIDAAKVPGGAAMAQTEINRHLIEHARAGNEVVRLKGGDPFVFGRGMEEVRACVVAGVQVDVVPGVTSAVGVPGMVGIPVTHRGVTHAFTVVSGHVAPGAAGSSQVDWAALAISGATLVLLMAVETLPTITAALLAAGMDPATPAASIENGASPRQRVVRSVLAQLAEDTADLRPPAVTVIGEVAGDPAGLIAASEAVAARASGRNPRDRSSLVEAGG